MVRRCARVAVVVSLLPVLAACGPRHHGSIDDAKGVCPEGQIWDGAQCSAAPGGSAPEGSGEPKGDAPADK